MEKYESFLPLSKSIAARKLILAAHRGEKAFAEFSGLIENHYSLAQDTLDLIHLLQCFFNKQTEFDVGEGGTSLRFFSSFLSRHKGNYLLHLGTSLAQRNHRDLWILLKDLGVGIELNGAKVALRCSGWPQRDLKIVSSMSRSSQHISGLILASAEHPFEIQLDLGPQENWVSEDYLDLTLRCCGIELKDFKSKTKLEKQLITLEDMNAKKFFEKMEPDLSSAFSLASLEFLKRRRFDAPNRWKTSHQPDRKFIDIFEALERRLQIEDQNLFFETDLRHTPDLAPVLAILLAALGFEARLHSLHHLRNKESPRDKKISDLLNLMSTRHTRKDGSLFLYAEPTPKANRPDASVTGEVYNPANDHRMVMAAALAQEAGFPIDIQNTGCVDKSFPLFWQAWKQLKEELGC